MNTTPIIHFVSFCLLLSISLGSSSTILTCHGLRNITIIPHVDFDGGPNHETNDLEGSTITLRYLVKMLLDKPCYTVWAFSPLRSRVFRLTKETYVHYFGTEFQANTAFDENELLNILSKMPHNNEEQKQTLFFVCFSYYGADKTLLNNQVKSCTKENKVMWYCGVYRLMFFVLIVKSGYQYKEDLEIRP